MENEIKDKITEIHKKTMYSGINRTYELMKAIFCCKNLKGKIVEVIKGCNDCRKHKKKKFKYGLLTNNISASNRNELICTDIIGPFELEDDEFGSQIYIVSSIDFVKIGRAHV